MFKVREVSTGRVHTVYAVSGLYFLVYAEDRWKWIQLSNCIPVEE